jgi:hypothetical protein
MLASRLRFPALAAAALLALPAIARANGRFPAAQHVMVGPGRQSTTIALRTTFGFAVSDDGGRSFHWLCEDALGYAGPPFDPAFAIDPRGRLHIGIFDGMARVSADRCTFERLAPLEGQFLIDLDQHIASGRVAVVTSSGGDAFNRVYLSDDDGERYRPLGEGLQGVLFETLEMAPTDRERVYLTAVQTSPRRIVAYRSDDGGATLRELPFPTADVTGAFVAGIDPTNADTVYVRVNLVPPPEDGGEPPSPTALLRSTDGGESWREIARTVGPMLGFAISDDGRTVWIGGPDPLDGLQRSDDGGDHWRRIGDTRVLCLRQHAGTLYVCGNFAIDPFALARSRDRGDTLEPLLRFEDLRGPFTCPPESPETAVCGARWPLVRRLFAPPETMDAGLDAGADAMGANELPPPPASGCGCRTAAPGRTLSPAFGLLAVLALRRRPARPGRA